eukprot:TRINITY_DN55404_c0_g1_i2.p1 TRINITY_DN55404_c0_g1~~TRINITY_DN55404_c0_g1_i2.p1  ORF type:complete len:103 (-),score=11.41 TRINITY_DN55404_c0_g1_i2:154-462(-)
MSGKAAAQCTLGSQHHLCHVCLFTNNEGWAWRLEGQASRARSQETDMDPPTAPPTLEASCSRSRAQGAGTRRGTGSRGGNAAAIQQIAAVWLCVSVVFIIFM